MDKNIISLLKGNVIAQFTSFAVVTITARIFTEINVMNEIIKNINKDQDVWFLNFNK